MSLSRLTLQNDVVVAESRSARRRKNPNYLVGVLGSLPRHHVVLDQHCDNQSVHAMVLDLPSAEKP